MHKIKTISITIAAMFICMAVASIGGAEDLAGNIKVDVKEWGSGVVAPRLNLENNSITLKIEKAADNVSYVVNDTLVISLDVNDTTGRESFVFPRFIFYSVIMSRSLPEVKWFPLRGLIGRLFPLIKLFNTANVVDSWVGGNKSTNITIKLDYEIQEQVLIQPIPAPPVVFSENLTMNVYVMGFMPGTVNGLIEDIPIITHQKITLDITYEE